MSNETIIDVPHPVCINCDKEIEECTFIFYGGDMGETAPNETVKHTFQVYWCAKCFEEHLKPLMMKAE